MEQWTLSLPYTLEAERFMYEHASLVTRHDETIEAARTRCAREMAQAEMWARNQGITFGWEDDWDDWTVEHQRKYDATVQGLGPSTCETALAYDRDGNMVTSLSCVDDATPEYRRVIEAELASELLRHERSATMALANCPELRALVDYTSANDAADLSTLIAYATS